MNELETFELRANVTFDRGQTLELRGSVPEPEATFRLYGDVPSAEPERVGGLMASIPYGP